MTVGVEPCQADLFKGSAFVRERLAAESVFAVLEREGCRLFPEAMFDDLFSSRGRRSVAPRVVACVMVLQRWFGLSDREAVAAFEFDLRWRFACGGLDVDGGGFCHTVLVGMRARLAASSQPRRIFDAVLAAACSAGALSQRRVLDSVPIYDAVATQDTASMLQRAIGAVLAAASDAALGVDAALRGDYASGAKPRCDWDDPRARQELVDRLGADAAAVLAALEGRRLRGALSEAAELLAAVAGQDLCQDRGGRFMIARRVAKDRVLSTVDPDARHGHKSTARRFDGYKGHTAVDPDSELITATAVTPANTADAQPAPELINDLLNTDGFRSYAWVASEPCARSAVRRRTWSRLLVPPILPLEGRPVSSATVEASSSDALRVQRVDRCCTYSGSSRCATLRCRGRTAARAVGAAAPFIVVGGCRQPMELEEHPECDGPALTRGLGVEQSCRGRAQVDDDR